jgi:hypothetical protein
MVEIGAAGDGYSPATKETRSLAAEPNAILDAKAP